MVDTLKLKSPYITEDIANQIERSCTLRSNVELSTGELLYSFTSGQLPGSWDDRVSVTVEREEWIAVPGAKKLIRVPCRPYVTLEGSVHKALLGHNIYGGPLDPIASSRWFVSDVSRRLEAWLPDGLEWQVMRVDWSEVYKLPSFESCTQFIRGLRQAHYPRRKVATYGQEGIYCPGDTATLKIYHKGPEFKKHDRKRLIKCLLPSEVDVYQLEANLCLRLELSIKATKLERDFNLQQVKVLNMSQSYLEQSHDEHFLKLLRETAEQLEVVRKHDDVRARLNSFYSKRQAAPLYGFWMQLAAVGEEEVKRYYSKPTFYRYRTLLVDAAVSWKGSDVIIDPSRAIPDGFSPTRNSPFRLTDVHPRIIEQLQQFELVA